MYAIARMERLAYIIIVRFSSYYGLLTVLWKLFTSYYFAMCYIPTNTLVQVQATLSRFYQVTDWKVITKSDIEVLINRLKQIQENI